MRYFPRDCHTRGKRVTLNVLKIFLINQVGSKLQTIVKLADPERLELPTPAFEAQCSIHLSYGSEFIA